MDEMNLPTIFDLENDSDGILRMPFYAFEYENPHLQRKCYYCQKKFSQSKMKELNAAPADPDAIIDAQSFYGCSLFICQRCWFTNDISDASKWSA